MKKEEVGPPAGPAVDKFGNAVVDPTANVSALVKAEKKRQDDLRKAENELTAAKLDHQKEVIQLHATYQKEMAETRAGYQTEMGRLREQHQEKVAKAESGRLDSIRQVDREEVVKTAGSANTAIAALAKQTTDLATTLAKQVADTNAAAEARNSTQYSETNKRLSALELSSSEGKGKQAVADPQMDKLTNLVEMLAQRQDRGRGQREGVNAVWVVVLGAVGMIASLLAITGVMYAVLKP